MVGATPQKVRSYMWPDLSKDALLAQFHFSPPFNGYKSRPTVHMCITLNDKTFKGKVLHFSWIFSKLQKFSPFMFRLRWHFLDACRGRML